MAQRIDKVLIANRGEIAVRIAATMRTLGVATVAIYSDADVAALHVQVCDQAERIGPAPSRQSYLDGDAIVAVALRLGVDAIHPGYGFLAENADFAAAVHAAGLIFIGPPVAAMRTMGDKTRARAAMSQAGVPTVPGALLGSGAPSPARAAARLGYPVMLKAAAGGGGTGMRRVDAEAALDAALASARSEALSAFGDATVYMEKYVAEPRHVEVQVFGDVDGKIWVLGERECSLQRRHQKVVEESPCHWLTPALRQTLCDVARKAAAAVDYRGAGTIEFLVDAAGNGYFLEMNTRLQVEHAVTEACFGVDLVAAQLRVARGEKLSWPSAGLPSRGHAIEVRLYAEDPAQGFLPSPGHVQALHLPDGAGIRVDRGLLAPCDVSPHYDPMLCKIIAWGEDRPHALGRLRQALRRTRVLGIRTNLDFLQQLMAHPDVVAGHYHTGTIAAQPSWAPQPLCAATQELAVVAAVLATWRRDLRAAAPTAAARPAADRRNWQRALQPMGL